MNDESPYKNPHWSIWLSIIGALNNGLILLIWFGGCEIVECDYVTGVFWILIWPIFLGGILFFPLMALAAANLIENFRDGMSNRCEVSASMIYAVSLAGIYIIYIFIFEYASVQ